MMRLLGTIVMHHEGNVCFEVRTNCTIPQNKSSKRMHENHKKEGQGSEEILFLLLL